MVAYNLLLSVFPLALVALFVAGRVSARRSCSARCSPTCRRIFPQRRRVDADGAASAGSSRSSTTRRDHRRRDLEPVGRRVVLGRARHRVLPHLPPAVPHVGAPEAVRARDARRRPAVHRGERRSCRPLQALLSGGPASCRSGSPTCTASSTALTLARGRARPVRARCAPRTARCPRASIAVALRVARRARRDLRDGGRRLGFPLYLEQRLDAADRQRRACSC